MARTIWLHIGLEKTGTKSVQDFCAVHRAELAETGLIFPQLGFHPTAHFALAGAVLADGDDQEPLEFGTFGSFDEEWGALAAVLDQHPHDDVLLSAEHFSSRVRASGIARIARWFDDRGELPAVRVVVNLRRQDELLLSTYGMDIRHGRSIPFDEYWPSHLDGDWRRYDFDATLSDWAREFGDDQLVVGVHERSAMPEGVVAAFFDLLGRPLPPGGDTAVHLNAAWSIEAIEVARILNRSRPDFPTAARFLLADRITYLGHATPAARLFGARERAQVLSRFEASNARVARRFVRRGDGPLFADPVPTDPSLDPDEVSRRTSVALTDLLLDLVRGQDAAWRQLQAAELDHAHRGEVLRRLAEDERVPGPALDDALAGAHDESHGDHGP